MISKETQDMARSLREKLIDYESKVAVLYESARRKGISDPERSMRELAQAQMYETGEIFSLNFHIMELECGLNTSV